MTAVTGARGGLKAHQDPIRLPNDRLVRDLRDLLGAKQVADIGTVKKRGRSGSGPTPSRTSGQQLLLSAPPYYEPAAASVELSGRYCAVTTSDSVVALYLTSSAWR